MKRVMLLCFLCHWMIMAQAQSLSYIIRVKGSSGIPLPFVAVGVPGTNIGTMTDDFGIAQLISETPLSKIKISCIGYQTIESKPVNLPDTLELVLKEVQYELPVTTVKAGKLKKVMFGLEKEKTNLYTNFAIQGKPRQNLGAAMGKIVDFGKESHCLDRFRIFLAAFTFDTVWLRLNIYQADGHEPGAPLVQEGILIPVTGIRSGWVNVSLASRKLILSGEVFLAWNGLVLVVKQAISAYL